MQVENFGFKKFSLTIQILATMQVCTDAEINSAWRNGKIVIAKRKAWYDTIIHHLKQSCGKLPTISKIVSWIQSLRLTMFQASQRRDDLLFKS